MEEKILAAITSISTQINSIDKRIDAIDKRIDVIDKRMDAIDKRMDAFEAGQEETHQLLRAVLDAQEKNAAEIEGLKHTTASIKAIEDLRRDVHDAFYAGAQFFAKEG